MPLAFRQWHLYRFDFMVPLTGLEPVRCCQRGIFMPHYVAIAARSKRCGLDFIFAIDPRP